MNHETHKTKATACPHCRESHVILEGAADLDITIVCAKCRKHYRVNLLTQKTAKKRSQSSADDNDVPLLHKLKCPYDKCTYVVYNQMPVETIISVMCPKHSRIFRANLASGRTWKTAPLKK